LIHFYKRDFQIKLKKFTLSMPAPIAVPPVPVHELSQLAQAIGRIRPSFSVQEIQEEMLTRRTRNSSRMLGSRVAWLANEMRSTLADKMMDRARRGRRQHRVASVPDQWVVEQVRQDERERGGPPAPRNSLDLSGSNEYEIIEVNDDESDADGGNIENLDGHGHEFENNPSFALNMNDYVGIQGVPPLIPSVTINALEGEEPEQEANRSSPGLTIDLTESPARRARPESIPAIPPMLPPPRKERRIATPISPESSPKCPVCLETFRSVHGRGHGLVSTLCGHVFCGRCLPACVRTSGHCPTCRKRIGYDDFPPSLLVLS